MKAVFFCLKSLVLTMVVVSVAFGRVEKMPDLLDTRDGQVYKTVQIGTQRWMAENLRFKVKGSYCYDDRKFNCDVYGRLYDWAMSRQLIGFYNSNTIAKRNGPVWDICPSGWHIPTNKDWKMLKYYTHKLGKSDGVGISLKSKEYWDKEIRIPAGSDEFGFNALPAGERQYIGEYAEKGASAQFWASNENGDEGGYYWRLTYDTRTLESFFVLKKTGASIRCMENKLYEIKEPPPPPPRVIPQVVKIQDKETKTIHIGNQIWMANNLNVKVEGSFCYEDKEENCEKFGRLYTWPAALKLSQKFLKESGRDSIAKNRPLGICPNGWHVPTLLDFEHLKAYLKDIDEGVGVGTNLRSREGWAESDNAMMGEDGFGFNALPMGYRDSTGAYVDQGKSTAFWTGSEKDSLTSFAWRLSYDEDDLLMDSVVKGFAFPIRCMMNPPEDTEIYDSTALHDRRDDNRYKTVKVGNDVWMAENLRYASPGSFCYEDKDIRCRSYGRLYPWHVAMRLPKDFIENSMPEAILAEHQGLCPDGWHIPTNDEWIALGTYAVNLRKGSVAAALKHRDGWARGGKPISNASGFMALPAGSRYMDEYNELGSSAYFWAAHGGDGMGAVYWNLVNSKDDFTSAEEFESTAFSVRCVRNKLSAAVPATPAAPATQP